QIALCLRRKTMESKVQVKESSFIAPSEATPTKVLWLSPLDLLQATNGHTPMVYLYRAKADGTAFFDMARIKEALAKALVAFYPLAGRLGVDENGRIEIICNSEGVLFVVADSDLTADDFDFKPSPELGRIFVPRIEPSSIIMGIQVTLLKCGSAVLGTAIHHAAGDGLSAFNFIQTWSAFSGNAAAAAAEQHPCHDRDLLRPRSPPVVHPDALSVLFPEVAFSKQREPTAAAAFTISKDQVAALRRRCGGASAFCAVSALVWQCACAARRLPPGTRVRLVFPAEVRRKLRPPLPDRYFGNAVVRLGVARHVTASESSLASIAGHIAGAIAKVDDELVRSAIDYLELAELKKGSGVPETSTDLRVTSWVGRGSGGMPETDLRITSWLGMPVNDVDFGWGKPQVMSRADSVCAGSVYLMEDAGDEGVAVRMLLGMEAANMDTFERIVSSKRCHLEGLVHVEVLEHLKELLFVMNCEGLSINLMNVGVKGQIALCLRRKTMESKVQVKESSFIAPSEATPTKVLWLSPLDLLQATNGHTPMVYLYRAKADGAAFFDMARIKEALAKALVAFYPLAGRLGVDENGRIEIICNSEGVLFVVADSDLTADDFDFKPSPELGRIFVPRIEPSSIIMGIQVTLLKCGSAVLGTAIHHAAGDGLSAFNFIQTWLGVARHVTASNFSSPAALASVAGHIASAIAKVDDELVRSAIDYLELAELRRKGISIMAPETTADHLRVTSWVGRGSGGMPETDLRITSWLGMPVNDVDFGWGKPQVMSRADSVGTGSVYLMEDAGEAARAASPCACSWAWRLPTWTRLSACFMQTLRRKAARLQLDASSGRQNALQCPLYIFFFENLIRGFLRKLEHIILENE
ncbi:hypothetical protein EJB05_27872, partial [Eragrostis curvula]